MRGRFLVLIDVGRVEVYLLSPLAKFVTGMTLTVDGGMDMRGQALHPDAIATKNIPLSSIDAREGFSYSLSASSASGICFCVSNQSSASSAAT